jgi:ribonuclease J
MVSITCFGGLNEIGGNKICIEDRKTKIFLDFGESFSHLDDYFVDWLMPRTRFGLRDHFALGLMPKLKGLYNKWSVERTDLEYSEPEYHGVFISHAHFDHIAHLRYLDQSIPVHLGETARTIIASVNETSTSWYLLEKAATARDGNVIPANTIRSFRTGEKVKVDDIEVVPVHVDHSAPGSYGFIVHTSEGAIVYTGDIRRHGNKPELTKDFIEKAKESDPRLLLIEGTRVAPSEKRKDYSEQQVYSKSLEVVRGNGNLTLAMRYPKDLDRFRTFYELAKASGKTLVVSLKTAHLLRSLKDDKALALPDPFDDESIRVYKREMKIYKPWELPLLERCVDCNWVKGHQKEIIWELDFYQLTELIDVRPEPGGSCIHSMSEPFEEDPMSQLQDDVLQNWLGRFSLRHHQLHASGHASMSEIFDMVDEIKPTEVVPIHTRFPELFGKTGKKVRFAKRGEAFEL